MRRPYVALAAVLLLGACGTESSDPEADPGADPTTPVVTPTAMPTEIPAAEGEVMAYSTVLDDGDGAELCLGGVLESLPPQCGGPPLVGWDWADHAGDYEEAGGTRWGEFVVTGTFDGTRFTPHDVVPAADYDAPEQGDEPVWHTPCPEPDGGWVVVDPSTTTQEAIDSAGRVASRLPTFSQMWVDLSRNPAADEEPGGLEWEMAMSDQSYTIVNVSVTNDLAGAEAAIREVWGGRLCVSEAVMTDDELRRIGRELGDLPGVLGYGGVSYPQEASVVFDDGSLQAWADQEYGEGVVEVSAALAPVED